MSRLILINAKAFERLLFTLGFQKVRQKGSHAIYKHEDGRTTAIPFHSGKDLPRPLIRSILSEIKISIDEYNDLLG